MTDLPPQVPPQIPPQVDFPDQFLTLKQPFPHFFGALHGEGPVRIVAMGSSSTAGRGDVVPYPPRLELYLRGQYQDRYPRIRIDVLNRGIGGQEAIEELARFKTDIFDEKPSLVIWQIGTNAVFHNYNIKDVTHAIHRGLKELGGQEFDVLLIDPQYTTAMLLDDKADVSEAVVSMIATAAEGAKVSLFRRWALMRHWHVHNNVALDQMIDPTDPDRLHQSDWSTMEVSKALCSALTRSLTAMS
jgi:hypothetical protein